LLVTQMAPAERLLGDTAQIVVHPSELPPHRQSKLFGRGAVAGNPGP
jgi:hypothetical protein